MAKNETPQAARVADWYRKWREPVCRWLYARCSVPQSDIDDLAQEVFIRLLNYSDHDLVEYPQSYLFRIASNVAHEWRERARNRRPHEPEWLDEIEDGDHFEAAHAAEQQERELYRAIDTLTERQWGILLWHMEDLTYFEIASKMGITYRVVLRDLTKAYSQLRMELKL